MILVSCALLCLCYLAECQNNPPIILPPNVFPSNELTCPLLNRSVYIDSVKEALQNQFRSCRPSSCGGEDWTKAAYLNMSDPVQQCPSNWTYNPTPVRGCGRLRSIPGTCDSVTYSVGHTYSQVCGRVEALQKGFSQAFTNSIDFMMNNINSAYLDGISLTHGADGLRQHIWIHRSKHRGVF